MMEFGGYFPPLTEQEHIVSYLDDKTTKIDELIQKKLRKIDLLKEYRTSLINTVVTKGLNPNVPMKDSGIEWIGEIPVSWNSGKMKYLLSNNDGGVWGTDIEDEEKGTLVVRSTEITIDGNWDLSQILKRYLTESEVIKCKLFEGDIVITKSSGSPQHIGKSVIVSKEIEELNCCYSNFVQRIRFRNYNSKLYHYILNSDIVRSQFKYLTTSSTGLGNLNETSLNDILLPFIPLQEQEHIVSYLDEKTSQIDKTIDIEKKKIELLKEYRQSLISNVVTGKIKVIE
jgi:type I restriction enzyme S subunit